MATEAIQPERQGWRATPDQPSLPEIYGSLAIPQTANVFRKLFAFAGPGFLIAVGYMDPGNWATDLAAGSKYNYTLLSVIMLSNFMAILLQALAIKLGVVSGRDLAQACRDHFHRRVRSRRSHWLRHRFELVVPHSASGRGLPHRARCSGDFVSPTKRISLPR